MSGKLSPELKKTQRLEPRAVRRGGMAGMASLCDSLPSLSTLLVNPLRTLWRSKCHPASIASDVKDSFITSVRQWAKNNLLPGFSDSPLSDVVSVAWTGGREICI